MKWAGSDLYKCQRSRAPAKWQNLGWILPWRYVSSSPTPDQTPTNWDVTTLCVPLWLPFIVIASPTVFLVWRNHRRPMAGYCGECGYNLTGNVSGRCPECGSPVPSRVSDEDQSAAARRGRSGLRSAACVLVSAVVLCAGGFVGLRYLYASQSRSWDIGPFAIVEWALDGDVGLHVPPRGGIVCALRMARGDCSGPGVPVILRTAAGDVAVLTDLAGVAQIDVPGGELRGLDINGFPVLDCPPFSPFDSRFALRPIRFEKCLFVDVQINDPNVLGVIK